MIRVILQDTAGNVVRNSVVPRDSLPVVVQVGGVLYARTRGGSFEPEGRRQPPTLVYQEVLAI